MLAEGMPELSQRTLANVMRVLDSLPPKDVDSYPLMRKFWDQLLFGWGLPPWVFKVLTEQYYDWTTIIRRLHAGELAFVPKASQQSLLKRLTTMAMVESHDTPQKERLRLSLQLDGAAVVLGELTPIQGPVSLTQEQNLLLTTLQASPFAQKELIAKHLKDAEGLFSSGKMHPAMGQSRSAFQASIEDATSLVESKAGRNSGGGVKNQIDFLTREKFISDDEKEAFLSAWGFLCAGAHPGLPPDEAGRIGFIFGLEFIQVLLLKAKNLL